LDRGSTPLSSTQGDNSKFLKICVVPLSVEPLIIWTSDLGRTNPGGIPAMYEANGRQYLVVCSTSRLKDKTKKEEDVPRGYIVYALPGKKQ